MRTNSAIRNLSQRQLNGPGVIGLWLKRCENLMAEYDITPELLHGNPDAAKMKIWRTDWDQTCTQRGASKSLSEAPTEARAFNNLQKYIDLFPDPNARRLFMCFRLNMFKTKERLRAWSVNTDLDPKCRWCTQEIETLKHLVLFCTTLRTERTRYLGVWNESHPSFIAEDWWQQMFNGTDLKLILPLTYFLATIEKRLLSSGLS